MKYIKSLENLESQNTIIERFNSKQVFNNNPPVGFINDLMEDVGTGMNVLDVGCGNGFYSKIVATKNKVTGIDIVPENIEGIKFIAGDICNLGIYPKEKFDVVLCIEVIEHLLEPETVLKNIHEVLKDDGKLVLTTPNYGYWRLRLKFLFGKSIQKYNDMHIRLFNFTELNNLLRDGDFKILHMRNHLGNLCNIYPPLFSQNFYIVAAKSVKTEID